MTRRIGLVVYPGFQILDAAGPIAAFEAPSHGLEPAPYAVELLSQAGGLVRSSFGVDVVTTPFADEELDTLLVVGGWGVETALGCHATLDFLRRARPRRIGSVCSGAYLLAEAGLLEGRRAATHWRRTEDFRRRFPRVRVEPDSIFVRDDPVWTSAGITAGIDLALALIADDLGEEASRRAAQELVVFHRRSGGQSQHSALLDLAPKSDRIGRALAFARENLTLPLTVEQLAEAAGLSSRQFARLFVQEIGRTPAKAIEQLRVEAARIEVEGRRYSLDEVARRAGFGDADRMRSAFLRAYGRPPQALRRAPSRGRHEPPLHME